MANPALDVLRDIERNYDINRAKKTQARDLNQSAVLTLLKLDHDANREDLKTARDELDGVQNNIERLTLSRDSMINKWQSVFGEEEPYALSANDVNQSSAGKKVFADNLDKYNNPEYGLIAEAKKQKNELLKSINAIESDITKGQKLTNSLEYISYKGGSNPDLYDSDDFTAEKISKETGISKTLVSKYIQTNPIMFGETRLEKLNNQLMKIDASTRQQDEIDSSKNISNIKKRISGSVLHSTLTKAVGSQVALLTEDMSDKDREEIMGKISSKDIASVLIPPDYLPKGLSADEFSKAISDAKARFAIDFYTTAKTFSTQNPDYAGMNLILRRIENNVASAKTLNEQNQMKGAIQAELGINMDEVSTYYHPDYRQTIYGFEDMIIGLWKKEKPKSTTSDEWKKWLLKNKKTIHKVLMNNFPVMSSTDFAAQPSMVGKTEEEINEMHRKYKKFMRSEYGRRLEDLKTILDKKR